MTDIEDKNRIPAESELSEYVTLPFFDEFLSIVKRDFGALTKIEFSGDRILYGWNLKLKKCGKTLCTVYPRQGYFYLLLVVGKKEKERVEDLLPSLCNEFKTVYRDTPEGCFQRWMLFKLTEHSPLSEDILKIIRIRRECR